MKRERWNNLCEKGILGLVLAVLIFGPLATGAVRPLEFLIIQGLTMSALLLWLVRIWLNPAHRIFWPPICWAVVAFVAYALIRYRQADLEYIARLEFTRVLVYAALFFVILNNLGRQEYTQLISCVMIFLAMGISVYAIYQFATNSDRVWHFIKPAGYMNRGSGTYICPNHLAGFLEMLLPLGLACSLTGRIGHVLRVFLGYASLVMLAGIAVSMSRGGWIATAVSLLLFFSLLIRRRQYRLPVLIIFALLATGGAAFYVKNQQSQKRVMKMFSGGTIDDAHFRFWLLEPTLRMWQDHPWLGVGPGHYDYRFPAYRPMEVQGRPGRAHSDYLNTLADWGVVGAAVVTTAWGLLLLGLLKTWKFVRREQSDLGAKPGNRAAFVLGGSVGLVAILVHSFVDFNMHIPANAILAVSLMAMLSGHFRFTTERYWMSPRWRGRGCLTAVGALVLGYLGWQGTRRAIEYAWLERAGVARLYLQTQSDVRKKGDRNAASAPEGTAKVTEATQRYLSALREAAIAEPRNFESSYELGEALRLLSWRGLIGYEAQASEAIQWFSRGIALNPYDAYNYLRIGMCLDWLRRQDEAAPYFKRALELDPNNYYLAAHQGWHFVQTEDYASAKTRFERSLQIKWWDNPIAQNYLAIVNRKLQEVPPKPK